MSGDLITEPKKDTSSDDEPVKCPAPPNPEPWCEEWGYNIEITCCAVIPVKFPPYLIPVPIPAITWYCKVYSS